MSNDTIPKTLRVNYNLDDKTKNACFLLNLLSFISFTTKIETNFQKNQFVDKIVT